MRKSWGVCALVCIAMMVGCKKGKEEQGVAGRVTSGESPDMGVVRDATMDVDAHATAEVLLQDAAADHVEREHGEGPLVRRYSRALISEEYHSLTVKWSGSGEPKKQVALYDEPEPGAEKVGEWQVKEGDVLSSLEDLVIVEKPRAFYPSQKVKVSMHVEDGEQEIMLETSQALYVFMYEGEGMCEVAILPESGDPIVGSAICPDNGYVDMEWTTSEGGRRDLPEAATWWMLLEKSKGERGWARFDLGELDLDLKIHEHLED